MPGTMGALYWQLNDCWPVASWSSIDYHHRWKALHYMAKRFFAPLLVTAVENTPKNNISIYITSDLLEDCTGKMSWVITNVRGDLLAQGQEELAVPPRHSRRVKVLKADRYLRDYGARDLMFWVDLSVDGKNVSSDFASFARPKHLELCEPDIKAGVSEKQGNTVITLTAKAPALWVWLDLGDVNARFSDNFFHILPGRPVEVTLLDNGGLSSAVVRQHLHVHSLIDTYR
jgi:beta-mannosidase